MFDRRRICERCRRGCFRCAGFKRPEIVTARCEEYQYYMQPSISITALLLKIIFHKTYQTSAPHIELPGIVSDIVRIAPVQRAPFSVAVAYSHTTGL